MRRFSTLLIAAILGGALVAGYGALFGEPGTVEPRSASAAPAGEELVAKVASEVEPSVVQVNVSGGEGVSGEGGVGSGIMYSDDG